MSDSLLFTDASTGLTEYQRHAALIAFNRYPSCYLHHSRRSEFIESSLSDYLFEGAYAHKLLSDYILCKTGLTDIQDADSRHPSVKIGMYLNPSKLRELACRLALIFIAKPIKITISRQEIAAWITALGEPLYRFVYKHAPLLDDVQFIHFSLQDLRPVSPETVKEQATAIGFQILHASSHFLENAIGQRIRFKLPREIAPPENFTFNPDHTSQVWTWINRISNSMPMHISPLTTRKQAVYK